LSGGAERVAERHERLVTARELGNLEAAGRQCPQPLRCCRWKFRRPTFNLRNGTGH